MLRLITKQSMKGCYMLDKIAVNLDDVKQICKKHSFDMDHFWIEINKRFSLNKSKNAGECQSQVFFHSLGQRKFHSPIKKIIFVFPPCIY